MKASNSILQGYENTRLIRYSDMPVDFGNTVEYKQLGNLCVKGVLKADRYVDGELIQTYSEDENHILTIAATRLGKTTSCVIPQIISFAKQQVKRSMIISDPKGELYRLLASLLKDEGYDVLMLNLRDYSHSELWNPLTPIFKKYQRAINLEDEVEAVETAEGARNRFHGVIYEKQSALDDAIEEMRNLLLADVDSDIDKLMFTIIPQDDSKDQYWNEAPRQWGKAHLWAMLEDSSPKEGRTAICEDTFSFNTMFTITDFLTEDEHYDNNEYFSSRGNGSRAYNYARGTIENASGTRQCIISCFNAKLQAYRNSTIRLITACSSFDMARLASDKPTVVFISYPDETKVYYQVISTFVQNAYTYLINYANDMPSGKLDVPFYFILDEFGNFPKIVDFDTVISACGGRNIWFDIVLQSYAQLDNVYGKNTAEIIRDNLNVHIFLGSNNPATLELFSKECGNMTRISPRSALNGSKEEIDNYDIETIPLVPRSMLANLKPGECIVTEANCGYVLFSRMERYFLCKEFCNLQLSSDKDYVCPLNPLDKKYIYTFNRGNALRNRRPFDF
ncbi:MAG: type IV secretory system conjugative DNA transfer family protein [Candidatus Coproplasma sp.]